jgi:hypothetical protein
LTYHDLQYTNKTVKANSFFDSFQDGLSKEWIANTVFCNPPYGKTKNISNQHLWSAKMIREFLKGNFKQGILLVNSSTSEKWFKPLWDYPLCFTDHRIRFIGAGTQPPKGNVFVYFGNDANNFARIFNAVGNTVQIFNQLRAVSEVLK